MAWIVALALLALPLSGRGLELYVGDPVTLNATEGCDSLIRRLKDDSSLPVATLVDGVWTPDELYKGRIEHVSKLSVTLTSVNYNDNGQYEFTSGNRVVPTIELKVLITFDISVTEGEEVKLPCYYFTADKTTKLRWEKDGELLLEQDGELGQGTERRNLSVGVSDDWFMTGDLSLTLGQVQPKDEGLYVCYIGPEKTRGEPGALRVKIPTQRNPDQITCAPQTGPPTQPATEEKMGTWTTIGVVGLLVSLIVGLLLGFGCGWWVKSSRSNPRGGGSPTDIRMEELDLEQQPFTGPQLNGGPLRVNGNG